MRSEIMVLRKGILLDIGVISDVLYMPLQDQPFSHCVVD